MSRCARELGIWSSIVARSVLQQQMEGQHYVRSGLATTCSMTMSCASKASTAETSTHHAGSPPLIATCYRTLPSSRIPFSIDQQKLIEFQPQILQDLQGPASPLRVRASVSTTLNHGH